MLIAHELTGRRILIAHEDEFLRKYLSGVLTATGAIVVRIPTGVDCADAGLGDLALDAAVVSRSISASAVGARIGAAMRGTPAVLVAAPVAQTASALRSLAAPYAGVQVVDALGEMLGRRHAGANSFDARTVLDQAAARTMGRDRMHGEPDAGRLS